MPHFPNLAEWVVDLTAVTAMTTAVVVKVLNLQVICEASPSAQALESAEVWTPKLLCTAPVLKVGWELPLLVPSDSLAQGHLVHSLNLTLAQPPKLPAELPAAAPARRLLSAAVQGQPDQPGFHLIGFERCFEVLLLDLLGGKKHGHDGDQECQVATLAHQRVSQSCCALFHQIKQ